MKRLFENPVEVAQYIEVGDKFDERLFLGHGVLGGGVVTTVDREFGCIGVRYTSGCLAGVERPESAANEMFDGIVKSRILLGVKDK